MRSLSTPALLVVLVLIGAAQAPAQQAGSQPAAPGGQVQPAAPGGQAPPAGNQAATAGARALREMTAFLIGDWVGEASGEPGQGSGGFTFEASLDGNIVVRRSRTEFPASGGRAALRHDDLLVIYPEGGQVRADYFDNEGHVLHYTVSFAHESATLSFISPIVEGQPRQRLVYRPLAEDRVETSFEIAPPGAPTAFKTHVKGICRRRVGTGL